jgi:CheY-like chemotaxis protein
MTQKKRVLIADNSISTQKLVQLTLAEMEFEVVVASDGLDALSKARTLKPAWVFADCRLEQIDGIDLLGRIRKEPGLERTKLVLLKNSEEVSLEHRIRGLKPHGVLIKPFQAKGLKKIISDLEDDEPSIQEEEAETITQQIDPHLVDLKAEESSAKQKVLDRAFKETLQNRVDLEEPTEVLSEGDSRPIMTTAPKSDLQSMPQLAEKEIRQWIEKNLPALAERLIKEEISKAVKS